MDRTELYWSHMSIAHRGRDRSMCQELLDISTIYSLLHEVGSDRVSDDMRSHWEWYMCIDTSLSDSSVGVDIIHSCAFTGYP